MDVKGMNGERPEKMGPPKPEIKEIAEGIYDIISGNHQYLIIGSERALLIDTGMGTQGIRYLVESVTDLPVILINTHGHPDHAGGNAEFDPAYMNPADFDVFEKMATKEYRVEDMSKRRPREELERVLLPTGPHPVAIEDGAVIDLGGRTVRTLYTPGHTHGSMCIFDDETGYMFTGDNAMKDMTSLHEWNASPLSEFVRSLEKMKTMNPSKLFGGHDREPNSPELLDRIIACANAVLGGAEGEARNVRGYDAYVYEQSGTSISYIKDKVC